MQLLDGSRDLNEAIVRQIDGGQCLEATQLCGEHLQLVVRQVDVSQRRHVTQGVGQGRQAIVVEGQRLELLQVTNLCRKGGCNTQAPCGRWVVVVVVTVVATALFPDSNHVMWYIVIFHGPSSPNTLSHTCIV